MDTKRKKPMSTEDIAKDMEHLILLFGGEDGATMKSLITAHLIVMGWDRGKATSYARLVEEYASIRGGLTSIWSSEN